MKIRLLEATETVCTRIGFQNVALQDILEAADVARGTFYAHFESLHDAIALVARKLINDAQADHLELYASVSDPLLRIAVGPQLFLTRAALQPAWASTIIESGELLPRSTFVRAIRRDVLNNMRQHNFPRRDPQAAVDLHVGAMIQGSRSLQRRLRNQREYIMSVDFNLLVALGASEAKAAEMVEIAAEDLRGRAPTKLDWWRDLS